MIPNPTSSIILSKESASTKSLPSNQEMIILIKTDTFQLQMLSMEEPNIQVLKKELVNGGKLNFTKASL